MAEWGHVRRGYAAEELDQLVGAGHEAAATFITPFTVVAHDIAFSRLPARLRRSACLLLSPLTWTGHLLHRSSGPGTETALCWRRAPTYSGGGSTVK